MFTVADETISRGARAYRARAGGDGGARPRADLAVGTRGHLPHVSDAGRVPGPDPVPAPSRERARLRGAHAIARAARARTRLLARRGARSRPRRRVRAAQHSVRGDGGNGPRKPL